MSREPLFRFHRVKDGKEEVEVIIGRSFAALVLGGALFVSYFFSGANVDWLPGAWQILKALL